MKKMTRDAIVEEILHGLKEKQRAALLVMPADGREIELDDKLRMATYSAASRTVMQGVIAELVCCFVNVRDGKFITVARLLPLGRLIRARLEATNG